MPMSDFYNNQPVGEDRVPPYNRNAEISVLGSILLDNACIDSIEGFLQPESFYIDANKRIYNAMLVLRKKNEPIDHVTLGSILRESGDLEKIGGAIVLSGLTDSVATSVNVDSYARIVREAHAVRMVLFAAQELVAVGYNHAPIIEIAEHVDKISEASTRLLSSRMPTSMFDLGSGVLEMYQNVAGGYRGVPLPWPTLDNMTAGMWPKTITIFVARPGTGKTQVAVISARHAWLNDIPTLVISPEMSKEEIAERFFTIDSGVSYRDFVQGKISDFVYPKLIQSVEGGEQRDGLWIMDADDDISPMGIEEKIRACKPKLLAIDSMYDLKIKGERRDRVILALEWAKKAAKKFNLAVVGFAQQNRIAELSEKKGGGSRLGTIGLADELGQDPHAVFALEQDKDMKADKVMKIIPLKFRRGEKTKEHVLVDWDFDKMKYLEIEEDDEEYVDVENDF